MGTIARTTLMLAALAVAGLAGAADIPFATEDTISSDYFYHAAADADSDGDLDLFTSRSFGWLENVNGDGSSWTKHSITLDFGQVPHFTVADFDGDEDVDVVMLNENLFGDEVMLYENTGAGWFYAGTIGGGYTECLTNADVDGDGDPDVVYTVASQSTIGWIENSSDAGGFSWTPHIVTSASNLALWVEPADLNGDGDLDLVAAKGGASDVVWHENDGADPPGWIERSIATTYGDGERVAAGDVDDDGDTDLFVAGVGEIYWHENDGNDPPGWTQHPLTTVVNQPRLLVAVDLDGDSDADLVSLGWGDQTVRWHENTGGDGSAWTDRLLGANVNGRQLTLDDLDGDGDRDVVVSTWTSPTPRRLLWFENQTPPSGAVPNGGSVPGTPLAVQLLPSGQLSLTWSPSCLPDLDYAVYEGAIGDFESHKPAVCSTSGATLATIGPTLDDAYYLVVPRNALSEGSYGRDADGRERPASADACIGQSRQSCP